MADAPLTPSAFLRLRADGKDPIAGLTHRDAASRLRHFGANETPSPPPDERARLLRELRAPAARVVWFALLLQLVQALLDTVADVNRGDLADDDTDDSAGAGRGAPAAWIDTGALLLLLAVNAPSRARRNEPRRRRHARRRRRHCETRRRRSRRRTPRRRRRRDCSRRPHRRRRRGRRPRGPSPPRRLQRHRRGGRHRARERRRARRRHRRRARRGDGRGRVPRGCPVQTRFRSSSGSRGRAPRRRGDHRGEARGVVIRTGAKTAIGKRATRANANADSPDADSSADSSASAYDRAVRSASRGVFFASAAACGVVFATLLFACRFGSAGGKSHAKSHSNANSDDSDAEALDVVSVASFVAALMVAAAPTATRAACAATAAVGCRRRAPPRVISRLPRRRISRGWTRWSWTTSGRSPPTARNYAGSRLRRAPRRGTCSPPPRSRRGGTNPRRTRWTRWCCAASISRRFANRTNSSNTNPRIRRDPRRRVVFEDAQTEGPRFARVRGRWTSSPPCATWTTRRATS